MAERHYNFRLGRPVPLLDEAEWLSISLLLEDRIRTVQDYRRKSGATLAEAMALEPVGRSALARYAEMTGETLDDPEQLWTVRMSAFGAVCPACGRPFRTPRAHLCAECGYELPAGQVAGPLASGL